MDKLGHRQARFQANPFYFVTCEELSLGRSDEEVVEQVLRGGIKLIQLRDKYNTKKQLFKKAERLKKMTDSYDALLIINDHLDVALGVGADGVHLGQEDLPLAVAQELVAKLSSKSARSDDYFADFLIGQSMHSLAEVLDVLAQGVGYYNIGPIYDTKTKINSDAPLGLAGLQEIIQGINPTTQMGEIRVPFSVMGGIKSHHLAGFWNNAVLPNITHPPHSIAMVTEICQQPNIVASVKNLMSKYKQFLEIQELKIKKETV